MFKHEHTSQKATLENKVNLCQWSLNICGKPCGIHTPKLKTKMIGCNESMKTIYRLQLKRGLLWHQHYPNLHEVVKFRSSPADFLTNFRQISLRDLFTSEKWRSMTIWSKKHQHVVFSWKIFGKLQGPYESCKKQKSVI